MLECLIGDRSNRGKEVGSFTGSRLNVVAVLLEGHASDKRHIVYQLSIPVIRLFWILGHCADTACPEVVSFVISRFFGVVIYEGLASLHSGPVPAWIVVLDAYNIIVTSLISLLTQDEGQCNPL